MNNRNYLVIISVMLLLLPFITFGELNGKIKKDELEQKKMNHKKSESEFQQFWNAFRVLD